MKYGNIFLVSLAVALAACDRTADLENNPNSPIRISVGIDGTKAVLNPADITTGTEITVYDVMPGVKTGDVMKFRIAGKTAEYGDPIWTIADEYSEPTHHYEWIEGSDKVDHLFYGWLTKDKNGLEITNILTPATNVSVSTNHDICTVTVPAKTLGLANYFDFCYATPVLRTAAESNYSTVNLELQHFFTCYGIKASNYTNDAITLKSVTLNGLTNQKSGSVEFNANSGVGVKPCNVTYSDPGTLGKKSALSLVASNITIPASGSVNNIITNGSLFDIDATNAYFLMWPQTPADLEVTTKLDGTLSLVDGVPTNYSKEAFLRIIYAVGSGTDRTVYVPVRPDSWMDADHKNTIGWDAGTRHQLEIVFTKQKVTLIAKALPWNPQNPDIDYSRIISVPNDGMLTLVPNTYTTDPAHPNKIYFKNGQPIKIQFKFDQPVDATWMISKEGDFDAFEIDNATLVDGEPISNWGDKIDYNYGTIDGSTATVTIYPKLTDPDSDREISLSFTVRSSSGLVTNADEEIQGPAADRISIVLQAS